MTLYLDGSFVTSKQIPADFDACWDSAGVDPGLLDPVLLDFSGGRAAQKVKYRGELLPSSVFLDFFQIDKQSGRSKGIIVLDLRRLI